MTLLDPKIRSERGSAAQADLTGAPPFEPRTPVEASLRDFLYAEIWTRPALDLRARFLISLAGASAAGDAEAVQRYARGALVKQLLSLSELREAALHMAVYGGWSVGMLWDKAVSDVAASLGLAEPDFAPIRAEPWDTAERHAHGSAQFIEAMKFGGPPPQTPYFEAGILNFVFGEMWCRAGLDQRSRRWITLVGVGLSSAVIPIGSHVWSALASGNASKEEMFEFVLQYAVHAGWPRGSVMQSAVLEQAKNVDAGLTWDGKERV
jgi:4-carboxymuconolactone decarboxylase